MGNAHPSAEVCKVAPLCERRRDNRRAISCSLDADARVLEGFAGTGMMTRVWAEGAGEVISIEYDSVTYDELCSRVADLSNVSPIHGNSKKIIPALAENNEHFSVVDLDDNGNFLDLLDDAFYFLRDGGYLSITCTAYMSIMRNLQKDSLCKRFGEDVLPLYERANVADRFNNRLAFSDLISARIKKDALRKHYEAQTLCSEIGYHAISKLFSVNSEPPQTVREGLAELVYRGPKNTTSL